MNRPRLALFDPYSDGHHPEYLGVLVDAWKRRSPSGTLELAVPERVMDRHPVLASVRDGHTEGVSWVAVEERPAETSLADSFRAHPRILGDYIRGRRPEHVLCMYVDHLLPGLATSLRFDTPVRISGIYFRASFHYGHWEASSPGWKERLKRLAKRAVLRRAMHNPHVDTIFSLDTLATPYLAPLHPNGAVIALPEPVAPLHAAQPAHEVRAELGIEDERRMLLLFGALDERKGLFELLDAIERLPNDVAAGGALVLAGRFNDHTHVRAMPRLEALQRHSPLQVILRNGFLPYETVDAYFHAADIILAPYIRHVGSSGVLVRAAMAKKPVLTQDYGLLGQLTQEYALGVSTDTTDPRSLADALTRILTEPLDALHDPAESARYVASNGLEPFSETLLSRLVGPAAPTT